MDRITVKNLAKSYMRSHAVQKSLKATVLNLFKNSMQKEAFWAVSDVSFAAREGETLGIIGANGAGKSTLLRLIAGTTHPTSGSVSISGRISSLLELGAGFHPDLTGRENIYLNGSILGISKKEINKKFDSIVEFSGLSRFIDSPVKFYSSGMYVRLGFAIAVEVDPDILLMDEVLAVGDEEFRKRSLAKVEDFKAKNKTMLIVSHDLETIKKMCDRVLFLDQGKIIGLGEPSKIVDEYRNFGIYKKGNVTVKEYGTREIVFEEVILKDKNGMPRQEFAAGEEMRIEMHCRADKAVEAPVFGFSISDSSQATVLGTNTILRSFRVSRFSGSGTITARIQSLNIQRGLYHLSVACHSQDHSVQYHRKDNFLEFRITPLSEEEGTVHMPVSFSQGA
jgi:ABC-type polysaccharide/polyol phosphate transport system ATPase subunit